MPSARTTKVREADWVSVQKAIRKLNAAAAGNTNVTYKVINVSTGGTVNLPPAEGGLTGSAFEIVDDAAARLALTWFLGRTCIQRDEGTAWIATTY